MKITQLKPQTKTIRYKSIEMTVGFNGHKILIVKLLHPIKFLKSSYNDLVFKSNVDTIHIAPDTVPDVVIYKDTKTIKYKAPNCLEVSRAKYDEKSALIQFPKVWLVNESFWSMRQRSLRDRSEKFNETLKQMYK